MHSKQATDLLDLSDRQWLSLNKLVRALEQPLDQPTEMVKRLLSAYSVDAVRPARIIFDDGTGQLLVENEINADNETLSTIAGHQLSYSHERTQAPEHVQRLCNGTVVEFTIPALHEWLIRCDLPEIAETLFGEWMRTDYPLLVKHNLMRTTQNQSLSSIATSQEPSANDNTNTLTLTDAELVELTGRKRGFAQHSVLQSMRIPSKLRADGAVIVLRHDLQATTQRKVKPKAQPNFDALG